MASEKQQPFGYTQISNAVFQDKRLNEADVGLLCIMLSLPPDWQFSVAGLCAIRPQSGRDKLAASIKRLENAGYLQRSLRRDGGKFVRTVWEITDTPSTEKPSTEKPFTEKPFTEKPFTEKPFTEKPFTEKPSPDFPKETNTLSNKELNKKELTEKRNSESVPREARERTPFVAPSVEEIESFCSQEQLSIDAQKFVDNYAAKGWTIGSTPVHDWKALVRKWAREDQERASEQPPQTNGLVEINGKQYLYKGGKYYVPGGCGVAVDPYAVDDLPF